jgi:hypothetical protein
VKRKRKGRMERTGSVSRNARDIILQTQKEMLGPCHVIS